MQQELTYEKSDETNQRSVLTGFIILKTWRWHNVFGV